MTKKNLINYYIYLFIFGTNHKIVSSLYFYLSLLGGMVGTIASLIIRLELATPDNFLLLGNHQLYNVIVSLHAFSMIFFMVMPALLGGFGN